MNEHADITIFAPADPASDWRWVVAGNTGRGKLAELAKQVDGESHQLDLLVPASACLITMVKLPAGRVRDRERALPFALEEQLAGGPDEDYLAYRLAAGDAETAVAAIDRERLDAWLDTLGRHGLKPHRICPDALNLPQSVDQDEIHCLTLGDDYLLRWGEWQATRCNTTELPDWLALIDPTGEKTLICHSQMPDLPADGRVVKVEQVATDGPEVLAMHTDSNPLDWVARHPQLGPKLVSDFSWRPTFLGAAALLVALLVWQLAGVWHLGGQADRLQAEIDRQMTTAFPEITTRVQGREADQAMNAINQRRGLSSARGSAFLSMLGSATEDWPAGIDLLGLDLSEGQLSLDVEAGAATQLDSLRRSLADRGLRAELSSVSLTDGRARAWLRLGQIDRG